MALCLQDRVCPGLAGEAGRLPHKGNFSLIFSLSPMQNVYKGEICK